MQHVHWPTPLVHISASSEAKAARNLICAPEKEKELRDCWGFVFLLQNKTTIHYKDKCTVFTFAWSASTFLFPSRDFQIFLTPGTDRFRTQISDKMFPFCIHLFILCSFRLHVCFRCSHTCGYHCFCSSLGLALAVVTDNHTRWLLF